MKKFLALVMAAILVFSVTACDQNKKPAESGKQSDASSSTVSEDGTGSEADTSQTGEEVSDSSSSNTTKAGSPTATTKGGSNNAPSKAPSSSYTLTAKGSSYATNIKLPKLSNAQISYMTNTTMEYIIGESSDTSPTAIYHALKIWKATYGVDVKLEIVPWDDMTNYLVTAVAGGSSPSVTRYAYHPKWAASKLLTPLDGLTNINDSSYDTSEIKANQFNGKTYALFGKNAAVPGGFMLYNASKFELNGVKTPMEHWKKGNWNFTQFVKTCGEMTDKKDGDEFGFTGWAYYPGKNIPVMQLNSNGTVKSNLNDRNFVRYMTEMYKLYQTEGVVCNKSRLANWKTTFPAGKDAMVYTDLLSYTTMIAAAKTNGVKDKFKIAPMPAFDFLGETEAQVGIGDSQLGICMPSKGKNQQAALAFSELYAKVKSNISKKNGETNYGSLASVLDKDEKAMCDYFVKQYKAGKLKKSPKDITAGIGTSEQILSQYLVTNIYFKKSDKTLSELIAYVKPLLETQIMEYEMSAGLR